MNFYSKAINYNEVVNFFRGEGDYFDLDRDRGVHNSAFTFMQIIDYGTEFGEEKLYKQLEADISNYLSIDDFSINDFNTILGIIWFYFVYRKEENVLKQNWKIPDSITKKINYKIFEFKSQSVDLEKTTRIIIQLNTRFDYNSIKL